VAVAVAVVEAVAEGEAAELALARVPVRVWSPVRELARPRALALALGHVQAMALAAAGEVAGEAAVGEVAAGDLPGCSQRPATTGTAR
jgi:hypothetical protein